MKVLHLVGVDTSVAAQSASGAAAAKWAAAAAVAD